MRITLDDSDIKEPTIKTHSGKKLSTLKSTNLLKQDSPSKVKKVTKIILIIAAILLTVFLSYSGYIVYKAYKAGELMGLNLKPSDIISQEVPTLKKDSSGEYTNILLVGIDTRERGNLLNTDTIILASYNHKTQDVILLSIPRDLHVQINPDVFWFQRINSIYVTYEGKGEGKGLPRLREVVEEITGYEIQYHAMVDFKGFEQLIDSIGGIDVNVENSFTDYQYPEGNSYKKVSFQQGPQHMDGKTALEYARSRHSLQNSEGSDFARARRQQIVLSAVTERVSLSSLLDPKSLMNLFNVVQDNIKISEFTINDIEAGIEVLKKFKDEGETYSFVLDPSAGSGKLLKEDQSYAIGPVEGLGKYGNIKKYLQNVWKNPALYEDDPVVRVYNTGLGYTETHAQYLKLVENFPYIKFIYTGTLYNDKESTVSYINKEKGFAHSLRPINDFIKPDSTQKPEYIQNSLNAEDITILYGKEIVLEENIQGTE